MDYKDMIIQELKKEIVRLEEENKSLEFVIEFYEKFISVCELEWGDKDLSDVAYSLYQSMKAK